LISLPISDPGTVQARAEAQGNGSPEPHVYKKGMCSSADDRIN
jgi:hypothetical protein